MIPFRARIKVELCMLHYTGTLFKNSLENWIETRRKLYALAEEYWQKAAQ